MKYITFDMLVTSKDFSLKVSNLHESLFEMTTFT